MSDLSKRVVIAGLLALPFATNSDAQTSALNFQEIKIYYMDWDVQTRMSVNVEWMREGHYDTFCHLKHNYTFSQKLLQILQLDSLTALKHPTSPNVRLIVDLISPESTHTYVAGYSSLYSLDTSQSHPIDDNFRNFFREHFANV